MLQEIFCRLDCVEDLAGACHVSKAWLAAARDDLPWRNVYIRQYGEPHAWETCASFREQCARRIGLRWPTAAPPLPGPPAPGAQLEEYDKRHGVRTLAVSYDPASRALLRAVRSRALVGETVRVAVQAICLEPPAAPERSGGGGGGSGSQRTGDAAAAGQQRGRADVQPAAVEVEGPSGSGSGGGSSPYAVGSAVAAASTRAGGAGSWVCMLSADGRIPPLPPPPAAPGAYDGGGDEDAAGGPAGDEGEHLTEAGVRQIAALAELLPTVMCCGGGLLYLPAGPMGRGLAVWDLTAVNAAAADSGGAEGLASAISSSTAAAAAAAAAGGVQPSHVTRVAGDAPHWLLPEAHPGRLLAAAADGRLAVSGCDGGALRFWRGRRREALGRADISELTRLPVLDAFPRPAAHAGAGRHRLRVAVCEASGLAVVALASPLAPKVYIYRATPRGSGRSGDDSRGGGGGDDSRGGGGGGGGGVGQLLAAQSVNGAPCSGLLLFRRRMLTMQVMCSDVMGARFGGSGGSSVLVTIGICMWVLPEDEEEEEKQKREVGNEEEEEERGPGRHWSDFWARLYSSRLQLEHPRTLVLGRMQPLLAATEDLMLLTVPRNVGGRPPHSQLMALELPARSPPGAGETHGSDEEREQEEEEEGGEDDVVVPVATAGAAAAVTAASAAGAVEEGAGASGGGEGEGRGAADAAAAAAAAARPAAARGVQRRERPRPPPPPQLGGIVGGGGGGGGRMIVLSEEDRLQWVPVIEDAAEVVTAVVPTPRHLALLSEDGRLRLYGIVQDGMAAVPPGGSPCGETSGAEGYAPRG